jgi:hypothetical protein
MPIAVSTSIETTTAPILAGGFITAVTSYTGATGPISQHGIEWNCTLPGTTSFVVERPWLAPLYAGTTFSTNADVATESTGRLFCAYAEDEGTFTAQATVREPDGNAVTTTADTASVGGYDQYTTTVYIDESSSATNGVIVLDSFADTVGTNPTDRQAATATLANDWFEDGAADAWLTDGSGGLAANAADGGARSWLLTNGFTTEVDVTVTIRFSAASQSRPTGITFRNRGPVSGNRFSGLWAGINPSAETVELRDISNRNTNIASEAITFATDTDITLRVYSDGSVIQVWVNGVLEIDTTSTTYATYTWVGLFGYSAVANGVTIKDFTLTLPATGSGASSSDPVTDIDIAAVVSQRPLDKVRFLVAPGTYTPTAGWLCATGSNVIWQPTNYANKPIIEMSSNSSKAFSIGANADAVGGSATATSERCSVSGFNAKNTGATEAGTPFEFPVNTPLLVCGYDQCSTVSVDGELEGGSGGTFVDSADVSICWTRNFHEGASECRDHQIGGFMSNAGSRIFMVGNHLGKSTNERPARVTSAGMSILFNDFAENDIKNNLRVGSCAYAEVQGNYSPGRDLMLAGNDGIADHVRITRNLTSCITLSDVSTDSAASVSTDIAIVSNIIDFPLANEEVDDGLLDRFPFRMNPPFDDVLYAHNSMLCDRDKPVIFVGWQFGSSGATYTAVGALEVENNVFAVDGVQTGADVLMDFNDTFDALDTTTSSGNVWPTAAQSSNDTNTAWTANASGLDDTEANWISGAWSTGDEFTATTFDANWVPSTKKEVTAVDGVHRDFFGRLVTSGDTVWAGAVISAVPSAATSANRSRIRDGLRLR